MRDCPGDRQPHASMVTWRAIWTIHASLGCGVTPAPCTFRLLRWMKKRTEYVPSPPSVQTSCGEAVGGHQPLHVRTDAFCPRGGGFALWRWGNAVALADVDHGLVTEGIPQIGQRPHETIRAPRAVLVGQAAHQAFKVLIDLRSTWSLALLGTSTLLRHQCTVPAEHGVGC